MMFSECATIGISDCAAADRLRDRDNTAGIDDNSAEIGDDVAGIVDIATNVAISTEWRLEVVSKLLPEWRLE